MIIKNLYKLTEKPEYDPTLLVQIVSLILGICTGFFISTREIVTVSTDFFEKRPTERTASLCKNDISGFKFGNKLAEMKSIPVAGGGNLKMRVTQKGVLGTVIGIPVTPATASAAMFGAGGFATDIDQILRGANGLKEGYNGGFALKGTTGIGFSEGNNSGFGGKIQDKLSITYSPNNLQTSNMESAENENPFTRTDIEPASTFSIDVDNATYKNIINYVNLNMLPPPSSIRIEEMINNFSYDYPDPSGTHPLSVISEVSGCPWETSHRILRLGIKGRRLPPEGPPASNYVFLIDVSGSMGSKGRLGILKQSLYSFVSMLHNQDRVSIITYADEACLHLNSTQGNNTEIILDAIDKLRAGGSTAGSDGIQFAYRLANKNFITNGNNRIILITDGNFNVGESQKSDLVRLISNRRGNGIFLTVIGMNIENDTDEKTMEQLANNGDGNFYTVYNSSDLNSIFANLSANFFTVAKDVKIQVQFNPEIVEAYRLIGYENRMLQNSDFSDDRKDAGEIGAEQTVTALYEIAPVLKSSGSNSLFSTVNIRYKNGDENVSTLMADTVYNISKPLQMSSSDFRFATAVAGLGLLLAHSSYKGNLTYDAVINLANSSAAGRYSNERYQFVDLAKKCRQLDKNELLSLQ